MEKVEKIKQLLIEQAEIIPFEQKPKETWWHVYDYPNGWGFKTVNGIVTDVSPLGQHMKNQNLLYVRAWAIENKKQIVKIP